MQDFLIQTLKYSIKRLSAAVLGVFFVFCVSIFFVLLVKLHLLDLPLIMSRQVLDTKSKGNDFIDWFGEDFDKLNIVTTFNLMYNATLMVKAGVGYAVSIDGIVNTDSESELCFRPLIPKMTSGLDLIWKKYQAFSPAAEMFLERVSTRFK